MTPESEIERLRAQVDTLTQQRDALAFQIECADTPLMREVLSERDAAVARAGRAEQRVRELESEGRAALRTPPALPRT